MDDEQVNLQNLAKSVFPRFEEACRSMKNAKSITEKKNLMSRISEFLNDANIIRLLDLNTSTNGSFESDQKENTSEDALPSTKFDWNELFRIIENYIVNELSVIKDKALHSTQTTTNATLNSDNKIYQLRSILNSTLNQINSNGKENLKLDNYINLYSKIYEINANDKANCTNQNFKNQLKLLNDLSNFLLNHILTSKKYLHELTMTNWLDFIGIYSNNCLSNITMQLSHDKSTSSEVLLGDSTLSLKCLRKIFSVLFKYVPHLANTSKIFSIFHFLTLYLRNENFNPDYTENLLGAMYEFCNFSKFDSLFEICMLGEEIGDRIVDLFNNRQASFAIKDVVLKFFLLQINSHDKLKLLNGKHNLKWMELLQLIFDNLFNQLISIIKQKLVNSNLKSAKITTSNQQVIDIESNLITLVSQCLKELISNSIEVNPKAFGQIEFSQPISSVDGVDDDEATTDEEIDHREHDNPSSPSSLSLSMACSANKRRRIERQLYSWSYIVAQLKLNLNKNSTIFLAWIKTLDRLVYHFQSRHDPEFLQFIQDLNQLLIASNLSNMEYKPSTISAQFHPNESKYKTDLINKSILSLYTQLIDISEVKRAIGKLEIDVRRKLISNCIVYGQFDLTIKLVQLEPVNIDLLVSKLQPGCDDQLCVNLLDSLASAEFLRDVKTEIKIRLVDFLLSDEFILNYSKSNPNIARILVGLICGSTHFELKLNDPIFDQQWDKLHLDYDVQFDHFYADMFADEAKLEPKSAAQHRRKTLPNLNLFYMVRDRLLARSRRVIATGDVHLVLAEFDLIATVVSLLRAGLRVEVQLTSSMNDQLQQNFNFVVEFVRSTNANVNLILGELYASMRSNKWAVKDCVSKQFIQLLIDENSKSIECNRSLVPNAFGLLALIGSFTTPIGCSLRAKLFKYLEARKKSLNELVLIQWISYLTSADRDQANVIFDYIQDSVLDSLKTPVKVYLLRIFNSYLKSIQESVQVDEKLLHLVDKYLNRLARNSQDSNVAPESVELQLEFVDLVLESMILKQSFCKNASTGQQQIRKTLVNQLGKILTEYVNNPNRTHLVKYRTIQLIVDKLFDNESMDHMFFDRIYYTVILSNKQLEQVRSQCELAMNQTIAPTAANTDNTFSHLKKSYAQCRKSISETNYLKHLIIYMFRKLTVRLEKKNTKLLVKCLFGLVQLNIEFEFLFDARLITSRLPNRRLLTSHLYQSQLVTQWLKIYLTDEDNDFESIICEKFPFALFEMSNKSIAGFFEYFIEQYVEHCLIELKQPPGRCPSHLDTKLKTALVRCTFLHGLNPTDQMNDCADFIKRNFYAIFESVLINVKETEKEAVVLRALVNMIDFNSKSDTTNRSKLFSSLIDASGYTAPFFFHRVLFRLNSLILQSKSSHVFSQYLGAMRILVETFLTGNSSGLYLFDSAKVNAGAVKFLLDFVLFNLANYLNDANHTSIMDLFQTLADSISPDQIVKLDFSFSYFVWTLLNLMNKSALPNADECLDRLLAVLDKFAPFSARLGRIVKFLAVVRTYDGEVKPSGLMFGLSSYMKKWNPAVRDDLNARFVECLTSDDIRMSCMFKYNLIYLTQLLYVQSGSAKIERAVLNYFIKLLVERLVAHKDDQDVVDLSCMCFSMLGPMYQEDLCTADFQTPIGRKWSFLEAKFLFDRLSKSQTYSACSFYLSLFEQLFECFMNDDVEMQEIADRLLSRMANTTEFALFLVAYDNYSNEYAKSRNETGEDSANDQTDSLVQFCKFYMRKKQTVHEIDLVDDEQSQNTSAIDLIKNLRLWLNVFDNDVTSKEYETWLKNFVCTFLQSDLCEDQIIKCSIPFIQKNVKCCERVFPHIFLFLINDKGDDVLAELGKRLNEFFSIELRSLDPVQNIEFKKAISLFVYLIEFLKEYSIRKSGNGKFWHMNQKFWDELDFLNVSKFCQHVNMYHSSIYYIEVWSNRLTENKKNVRAFDLLQSNPCSIDLLMNAFKNIDEISAIDMNLIYLLDPSKQVKFYEYQSFTESLCLYDCFLNANSMSKYNDDIFEQAKVGLVNSLKKNGLNHLLNKYLSNEQAFSSREESNLTEMKYNLSWKMGSWTTPMNEQITDQHYERNVYECINGVFANLKSFTNENLCGLLVEHANESVVCNQTLLMNGLKLEADLNGNKLNETFARLYHLNELKRAFGLCLTTTDNIDHASGQLFKSYANEETPRLFSSFKYVDDLLCLRLQLIRLFFHTNNSRRRLSTTDELNTCVEYLYDRLIDNSINHGQYQIGKVYIQEMANYEFIGSLKLNLRHAQLLRNMNDLKKAKFLLKNSIESFESGGNVEAYIESLNLYAKILNDTKSENPSKIIRDYLEKSISCIDKSQLAQYASKIELISNTFHSLAAFADVQYKNVCEYVKSKQFEEHAELMRKFQQESTKIKVIEPNSYFNLLLHKQYDLDREEMRSLMENRESYLLKSIEYYLKCLQLGSSNYENTSVFRVVSLWTENCTNANVNRIVEENIFKIATHKFYILLHQLAARMSLKELEGKESDSNGLNCMHFQTLLIRLLVNISADHPHHCLPVLFAFVNSHKDLLLTMNNNKSEESLNKYLMTEDRVNTANHIIGKLKAKSAKMKEIIDSMSAVCDAYIELANAKVTPPKSSKSTDPIAFPKTYLMNKIKNFRLTCVLTSRMDINPNGLYPETDLVYIVKFEDKFRVANGVNMPKIVNCIGSDGVIRKQLVKGKDDLRQDAVMQQFFSTVNDLILLNNNSRQANVKLNTIRTYKIVPLSQKSGVLEWCQDTITLGDWLIGVNQDGGGHKKYEPNDMRFDECKRLLYECQQREINSGNKKSQPNQHSTTGAATSKRKTKLELFQHICSNFKPVFRYFFTENFITTKDWYQKRLNYTKSVATASIVGYIVGLGDRHVQNILIDVKTADVVHIDLGIAFEQGKILPIPETVPFRLTRDIVDGFGICAIEGLFKTNCEAVLDLLKNSREQIITIFEVLLYDPLHNWCLSPAKALMLQKAQSISEKVCDSPMVDNSISSTNSNSPNLDDFLANNNSTMKSGQKNKIAERILLQIRQKLLGYENNTQLSTHGHVNFLINEAMSPENLCQIYVGWQPYL